MNDTLISPTARSGGDAAHDDTLTASPPAEGMPGAEAVATALPEAPAHTGEWTGMRIAALVVGSLLVLASLGFLGAGGIALWFDRTQRDSGYVTTDVHEFSSSGSALATKSTELGSAGVGWLYSPAMLGEVRIRATPVDPGPALFVGIGRSTDVNRYLAGVNHTVISEFWDDKTEVVDGGPIGSPPGTQGFWVASATGPGDQMVEWDPEDGSWTVVVMNADGRPGIAVEADLGARMPALPWIAFGVLVTGTVLLVGGGLLIAGAFVRRRLSRVNAV